MKIERDSQLAMSPVPESSFTGVVTIGGYFNRHDPSCLVGATVQFAPGARTPWKVNPAGQTLVILSGRGLVQAEGKPIVEVEGGDVIWCEPGERHWEGAAPDQAMRYFAIQEEGSMGSVSFEEKVTDDLYAAQSNGWFAN